MITSDKLDPRGVKWMGDIPATWLVSAVKRHYEIQLGKMLQNSPGTDSDALVPYVKALHVLWNYVNTNDLPEMWASLSEIQQYGVRKGDLLVCEGGEVGRAGIITSPPGQCIIQNALHRVRARASADVRYLQYVLHAVSSSGWFDVLCNKATIAHFTREKFADLQIPIPSLIDQKFIITFLDNEILRIDQLFDRKERQIELLQEKRTALISHAVTKGLNPKAKMKDSGIEWLGEIPEHWKIIPLRWYCKIGSGEFLSNEAIESERDEQKNKPVIGGNGILGFSSNANIISDTIVIGRVGALCGNVHLVKAPAWITDNALMLRDIRDFNHEYLSLLLRMMNLNRLANQNAQPLVTGGMIKAQKAILPPSNEQDEIINHCSRETKKIDSLATRITESIDKLREYRTALISAAVMGKIDVRKEAA